MQHNQGENTNMETTPQNETLDTAAAPEVTAHCSPEIAAWLDPDKALQDAGLMVADLPAQPVQVIALNNITRAVAVACSTDDTRPVLNGVHITPKRTAATDGRILLMADTQLQDAGELPSAIADCVAPLPESVIMPAETLNSAAKLKGKKSALRCLRQAYLCNGSIVTSDLDTTRRADYTAIEATFPNYQQVIPTTDPKAVVTLSAVNLDKIVKAAKLAGAKYITFGIREELEPVSITMSGRDEAYNDIRTIEGVVMPCNIN
jgi:DNA polymerase III sliding clamp (beta) subunit (PCNA family)